MQESFLVFDYIFKDSIVTFFRYTGCFNLDHSTDITFTYSCRNLIKLAELIQIKIMNYGSFFKFFCISTCKKTYAEIYTLGDFIKFNLYLILLF